MHADTPSSMAGQRVTEDANQRSPVLALRAFTALDTDAWQASRSASYCGDPVLVAGGGE